MRHGLNHKTVAKWRKRALVHHAPTGPRIVRSTVLTLEEEAIIVAFRRHTLLPLDDCLYALQASLPNRSRSGSGCNPSTIATALIDPPAADCQASRPDGAHKTRWNACAWLTAPLYQRTSNHAHKEPGRKI